MAITQAVANTFKAQLLNGVHQPGDDYKIALYTSAATLGATTTAYTATEEVSGTGYTAGGVSLTGFTVGSDGATSWIDFADPEWATITARGAMIYNADQSNAMLAVWDFGSDVSSTGDTFAVTFPAAAAATALIRIT